MNKTIVEIGKSLEKSDQIAKCLPVYESSSIVLHIEMKTETELPEEASFEWLFDEIKGSGDAAEALKTLQEWLQEGWLDLKIWNLGDMEKLKIAQSPHACWSWLAAFHELLEPKKLTGEKDASRKTNVFHFYGYKGGQARSALLAQFARELSQSYRHKVLVIDLDIEAPAQHLIFGKDTSVNGSTLYEFSSPASRYVQNPNLELMLVSWSDWTKAGVYLLGSDTGHLNGFKKIALSQAIATNPGLFKIVLERINQYAGHHEFDSILIDHSTGLNPLVLPALQVFPGKGVIFCKLDSQWKDAEQSLRILANTFEKTAVVSFEPHGLGLNDLKAKSGYAEQIELLKEISIGRDEEDFFDGDEDFIHSFWRYNAAFQNSLFPDLGRSTEESPIYKLAEYFEIQELTKAIVPTSVHGPSDDSRFIITPAVREILERRSESLFILGRKGTGKSRLVKYLSEEKIGFALLTDDQKSTSGLWVDDPIFSSGDANPTKFKERPTEFWWRLFYAGALSASDGRQALMEKVKESFSISESASVYEKFSVIFEQKNTGRILFLIDGIELLIPKDLMGDFVDALFKVLRNLDSFPYVGFQAYLRPDLSSLAVNPEQTTAKRKIDLRWNELDAFFFILYRIHLFSNQTEFFRSRIKIENLGNGTGNAWNLDKATDLASLHRAVLEVFDQKIRVAGTPGICKYLSSYFADEPRNEELGYSFNPRMLQVFCDNLETQMKDSKSLDQKISGDIVIKSHANAAASYLAGVKEELTGMLSSKKQDVINGFFNALRGKSTPLVKAELIEELKNVVTQEVFDAIPEIFQSLETLGMLFQGVGKASSHWRMSRLLREAIGMKISKNLSSSLRKE